MLTSVIKNVRAEAEKLGLVKEFRKGTLTQAVFCRKHNIAHSSFHKWIKEYSLLSPKDRKPGNFVAVELASSKEKTATVEDVKKSQDYLRVTLSSGLTIEVPGGFDSDYLCSIIKRLQ